MKVINQIHSFIRAIKKMIFQEHSSEAQMLLLGKLLSENVKSRKHVKSISEVEFKVFSQFGDDGIIQWLISNLEFSHNTFIEFGVEDYRESNTRFLMMNDNWSGFVLDGSKQNVVNIANSEYFWRYELFVKAAFIDCSNINELLSTCPFDKEVGILHIDLDGNDYWIWKEICVISPILVILEYNSVFGLDRAITVPYDKNFNRTKAHYSNLYEGASLRALHQLSAKKGYSFIGCNTAGNNAYFVRNDKLNSVIRPIPIEEGYVVSKFRESRGRNGKLTYVAGDKRSGIISGMPVYNTITGKVERF
ncbi:MAG: hypothetical protein PHW04_02885 [Candidatus Wallbacteria bacterium]|nr:hypothetical protein [Candidatus Wallbacteria bacterium]